MNFNPANIKNLLFGSRETVAFDIGTSNIKYVEVDKKLTTESEIYIKNFKIVPTPQDCLLSSYTENPIINPGLLKERIESIAESVHAINRNAILVLYDSTVIINWLNIPVKPDENLNNLVIEKLSTFLPVAVSEWFIDFQTLEEKNENKVIISEAILKKNLFEFGEIFQKAGINLQTIDISSFNVINIFNKYLSNPENKKKNIALVNMGNNNTTVMIFKEGILKNLRNLGVGGKDFTQNIMDAKGLGLEDAEKYKKEELFFIADETEEQSKIENYNIIKPSFGKLIKGMYDSFDHYLAKFREFKIHEIILTGGPANFKNIEKLIFRHLNIPVTVGSEILNIKYNGNDMMKSDINIFSSAIGALMR